MSLSKQLLVLISALFLMIFSVNIILSINNSRSYLEGEAKIHAQDTATSLGLSLSPYMHNETDPVIKTIMNAIFDRGYYQQIRLLNVEDQVLVTLSNKKVFEGVPDWFVKLIPMKTVVAESEISTSWSISGMIYVTLNPSYAYLKLYQQAVRSFYYSLSAFILSISLLFLLLRITLSPLKKINQMALNIAKGHFQVIEHLPWTTEVRNVTLSMNIMSSKLAAVINNLNTKLDGIGRKLQQDELTGLNKKESFHTEMERLRVSGIDAFVMFIKIDQLSALALKLNDASIDQFINEFADILIRVTEQTNQGEILAYRFGGSKFALLMQQATQKQAEQVALQLSHYFSELGKKHQQADIAHIGVTAVNHLNSSESILLAANEAYKQARLIANNGYYIRTRGDQAKDIEEWKNLIFKIVDDQSYQLNFIGQTEDFPTGQLLMEEVFTQAFDAQGKLIAIGTFVSIAEQLEKIADLDQGIGLKVIEYIKTNNIRHAIAINLSINTIKNIAFRSWLSSVLMRNKKISQQLVFSISAYAVTKEVKVYQEFIDFLHKLNARVMIKRFDTQSMSAEVIEELRPDFIRLSRDLSEGIAKDQEKKAFVETILAIGELLDIDILAENIQAEDDYIYIKNSGIAGASR
ncbi:signal protein [Methyloprofundus sedimenti]|uniref:Signal protein n=1 Tax=Methyloprofundus sedimenti TaxID=1420851 RepID=A0A1V8M646_9GAMM|nr:LapD/MoxY N-terminal periplasmic domain-containing protein [Methyloprofundus sedimenti]OQK17060.1 signal protein [Methyloprofundus sedimenti]